MGQAQHISIFLLQWWFLVHIAPASNNIPDSVRAEGPYPSLAFCKQAGKRLLPADRAFWTAEEIQVADAYIQRVADERAAELRVTPHDKDGYARLKSGEVVHFNKKGEADGSYTSIPHSSSYISYGNRYPSSSYVLVAPCTEIPSGPR